MTGRARAVGIACAATSVTLFSSFTLASRLGFASSLRLPDLAALRFGIGGALLAPLLLRHGLPRVGWRAALGLALLGGLGFAPLAYGGFALAPAAHGAVLLHGTLPLFTAAILRATGADTAPRGPGLVVIAAGVALMAADSLAVASGRQLIGDALLLAASASWSGYGVLARRLALPPAQGAAIVATLSAAIFLPLYALWPEKALLTVGTRELALQAVVQGALVGAVSIVVYTRAVAALGPATTSLFTAAVPCVTTLAAVALLGEHPSRAAIAGVVAVTVGLPLASAPPARWGQ